MRRSAAAVEGTVAAVELVAAVATVAEASPPEADTVLYGGGVENVGASKTTANDNQTTANSRPTATTNRKLP